MTFPSPETKMVRTPLLEVAYREWGPPDGKPVLLLHGWPDDAATWQTVAQALAEKGCRAFAPFLRGFGPTRFLEDGTYRSGQVTALAQDALDFADALGLGTFTLVGHDWGGRAAYCVAAARPERLERLVVLSVSYGSGPDSLPSLPQRQAFWYQWFFHLEQAQGALEQDRRGFCRYLWQTWMPTRPFQEDEFEAAALSWENPDWVAVTLHYYRHRWGHAVSDPRYEALEAVSSSSPPIRVPTVVLSGADDGCTLPASMDGQEQHFTAGYRYKLLPHVGHFPQRERPDAVVPAILDGA